MQTLSKVRLAMPVAAIVLVCGLGGLPSTASAATLINCTIQVNKLSMDVDFAQLSTGRRIFSTKFKAAPGAGFAAGQRMSVLVNEIKVGADTLDKLANGNIVGSLKLEDKPEGNEKPFPSDFPKIRDGTKFAVQIGGKNVIDCRL